MCYPRILQSLRKRSVYDSFDLNSMEPLVYDLFIQDFVQSNKLLNMNIPWNVLVSRRFVEDGKRKFFQFRSGGQDHIAEGEQIVLPDAEWFRIQLSHAVEDIEPRFDCLRMTSQGTHYNVEVVREEDALYIKLLTKNRGLINVVFVIRPRPIRLFCE